MRYMHDSVLCIHPGLPYVMSQVTLDRSTTLATCPDCDDGTINVQGIRTCETCNWFDR